MDKEHIERMKDRVWEKKPKVTTDYILCCILEELNEINTKLKEVRK